MKNHKKLIIFTLLAVVLIASAMFWYVRYNQENDRKTAALLAVANQFKAPADWTLASETIHEAKPGCIDVRCPSVGRTWEFNPVEVTKIGELVQTIDNVGWSFTEKNGCQEERLFAGTSTMCYLRGDNEGYDVTFIYWRDSTGINKATLTVE